MKKLALILSCSMVAFFANAQDAFDALRFGQTDIYGSARYMSMAGAFSALGGDPLVMTLNPAGLGLYRSSELSLSPNLMINHTNAALGAGEQTENRTRLQFNNVSYVVSADYSLNGKSGVSRGAFGFSFNRLKNFHRDFVAGSNNVHTNQTMANYLTQFVNGNGVPLWAFGQDNIYDDERIGWLSILGYDTYSFMPVDAENPDNTEYYPMVDANSSNSNKLSYSERGYINEWAFSYGHNFNDIFYLGFTFGIQDLDYERSSYYMENYFWQEEQNDITGWLDLYNSMITTGTGVNFKLGTIFRPNDDLRLALAFHSPTWYDMRDVHYADSDSDQRVDNGHEGAAQTPSNSTKYSYRTPYKFVAGFGYIIGKSAIASIDYEFTDYTAMNLGDSSLASNLFEQANNDIDNTLKPTHSIKLGLEYRLTSNYSLRGGFAHISSPIESDAFKQIPSNSVRTDPEYLITKGTQYYSVGFGYRKEAFTFDFAYQFRTNKSDLYMTELLGTESLNVTTNTHNIVATAGFRF